MRGSIFEIFGEEPGQAWNVKEELKYETRSSGWKEQAAHFVCVAGCFISEYLWGASELLGKAQKSLWGKKKRKEKKRIKSAFASPKDLDCSVELTCVGCSSICLHCLESCGGLLWVCSAPLAHSPRPSAVPDRVVQQQASMLSGRPEKQFGAWLLRWKAGSMAETTLFI